MKDTPQNYLVSFNSLAGSREQMQDALDKIKEVSFWYSALPFCIFCTTKLTANELYGKIVEERSLSGSGYSLFVSKITKDCQGWLPEDVWYMLSHPQNPRNPESKK